MSRRSQICLIKNLILKHQFQCSQNPVKQFSLKPLLPASIHFLSSSVRFPGMRFLQAPTLRFQTLTYPFPQNTQITSPTQICRRLSNQSGGKSTPELDVNKEVDMINLKFAEAREEIEMALESKETVYFNEEAECARVAVKEVLDMFNALLAKLPESEKAALQRSMGLKIEQLKAELQQMDD
ncbi:hypothetical protein K2173_015232 [Erythroxylum novogranatense]|uniref:Late embryogenesis abundant protein n=1 Tax=Erythroxylum novogranatense TaxID=1862640 RepID=A0AAV8T2T3_9ROSI|nr:hypothetical protein K2173_015232 [Erythroxylum novogranatense]